MIKDKKGKDLTEAEEIKKKFQEYTDKLYNKGLNDSINHSDVVTHLELDILEYEVKWALSGKIPAELFQILKDDAIKVNMSAS